MDGFLFRISFVKSSSCRTLCMISLSKSLLEESLILCLNSSSHRVLTHSPSCEAGFHGQNPDCSNAVLLWFCLSQAFSRWIAPSLIVHFSGHDDGNFSERRHSQSYPSGLHMGNLQSNYKLLSYSVYFCLSTHISGSKVTGTAVQPTQTISRFSKYESGSRQTRVFLNSGNQVDQT